jgi:hypothetical protein
MSLYMYRFDVVNTNMVPHGAHSRAGHRSADNDGYVTSTPTAGQSIEFQGVIDCHENLPRSLSSVLACTRRGHMCLA